MVDENMVLDNLSTESSDDATNNDLIKHHDAPLNLQENEELNLNNLNQENSNGLENFELSDESPKLFSTDDETNFEEAEKNSSLESDDELEIPAFLRRQKN